MAKRMTDDEIMDYTYNKLFGDLDGIESGSMFNDENPRQEITPGAQPDGVSGIEITIKPAMAAAAEGGRPTDDEGDDDDDEEDRFKSISKMSPLMAQLHGDRSK